MLCSVVQVEAQSAVYPGQVAAFASLLRSVVAVNL